MRKIGSNFLKKDMLSIHLVLPDRLIFLQFEIKILYGDKISNYDMITSNLSKTCYKLFTKKNLYILFHDL